MQPRGGHSCAAGKGQAGTVKDPPPCEGPNKAELCLRAFLTVCASFLRRASPPPEQKGVVTSQWPGRGRKRSGAHKAQLPGLQFSSVQSLKSCLTLCDPMNRSTPGLPVHHQLPEFTQTHVHRVGDAIQPSHPLSSPSPPAPNPSQHQSLFQ